MRQELSRFLRFILLAGLLVTPALHGQQINLRTQVTGQLQPLNGGTGLDTSGLTGCPKLTSGVWSFTLANCNGTGGGSYFVGTPTIAVTGIPSNNSMVWVATGAGTAAPRQLTEDDILPGFSITGFSCSTCGAYEIGFTVLSPTNFTASYSSTPASANITDGSHTTNLTSPFTSGSLAFNYTSSTASTTTFTLTAVSSSTATASQAINWLPRTFTGVGAAGATGSVTASGSSAVLSNGATLASAGLNNQSVYGPVSPSGQKVYILMIGNSHTFKDNATGFAFVFNVPTLVNFVNQNGATVTMYLYESTNTLTGTFSVLVAS